MNIKGQKKSWGGVKKDPLSASFVGVVIPPKNVSF